MPQLLAQATRHFALTALPTRYEIAVTEMHPLERRALERQWRARERTLQLEAEGL